MDLIRLTFALVRRTIDPSVAPTRAYAEPTETVGPDSGNYEESEHMLKITQATPNPFGKDKTPYFAPNYQLVNEWFQVQNIASVALDVTNVTISHITWNGWTITGEERLGWFKGGLVLQPGEAVRVHSGFGSNYWSGAIFHVFRNAGNYVLNNMQGDRITLRDINGNVIDSAWYEAYPPEGEILFRTAA
jgi:hypothetical protein